MKRYNFSKLPISTLGIIPILLLTLAACTQGTDSSTTLSNPQSSNQSLATAEECKLLNNAMDAVAIETGARDLQIVRGCPGFENITDTSDRFKEAGEFARADAVSLPTDAVASGPVATRIFQKMITRNVPRPIAEQQTKTPQFLSAVNAMKQLQN